jgi:hypothetical protein
MEELYTVEQLKKHVSNELIVAHILYHQRTVSDQVYEDSTYALLVGDHGEEVTFIPVVHHDIQVIAILYQPVHCDDARMRRREFVQGNLSPLKMALPGVEAVSPQALDRAVYTIVAIPPVDGFVDYTIGARTDDRDQLEGVVVDKDG